MRRLTFLLFSLFLGIGLLQAQTKVSGTVLSAEDGQPIVGAAIMAKGTSVGTVTDYDGKFSLNVPEGVKILKFTYVGMEPLEEAVKPNMLVKMKSSSQALDEVMVVAFGTVKKEAFTGSAATVGAKSIDARPIANVAKALEGAAAGVSVGSSAGQPGSSPTIRIRGIGSINASSDPLFVVDGTPYAGTLANLNPDDIESITVLKDASSSALYGSRAANGVIVVTTKKGKQGRTTFEVKVTQGMSMRGISEYDRVNAYQYVPLAWEAMRNGFVSANNMSVEDASAKASASIMGKDGLVFNPFNVKPEEVMNVDGTINPNAVLYNPSDLNWYDAISRTGYRGEYYVNASGANEKSDYFLSVGYLDEKGYIIKSDYNRFTARLNANIQPVKWMKAGVNIAGTVSNSSITDTESSTGYVNPFYFTRNIGPIYPVHKWNDKGEFIYNAKGEAEFSDDGRGAGASPGRNIVAETLWNDNDYQRNVLTTKGYVDFFIIDGLKVSLTGAMNIDNYLIGTFGNKIIGDGSPAGRARKSNSKRSELNFSQILTYEKRFGKNHLDILLGHENYEYKYQYLYGFKQGIIADGNTELINFTTINSLYSYKDLYRTEGYLSRANYDWDSKYYLSASYRRDGSSKFSKDHRWGNFWSVGASWRVDRERFMESASWLDLLKLRVSYGEVGNDALLNGSSISYYPWQSLYSIYQNGSEPGALSDPLVGNYKLGWESNNSIDVGLEFSMFESRLNGTFEFFRKESSNLLFRVPLPLSSGAKEQWRNIGSMYNQGFEISLDGDIIRTDNFSWNMNVNATFIKNKITKLPNGQDIVSGTKKLQEGRGIYDYWLKSYEGVDRTNGNAIYLVDESRITTANQDKAYVYDGKYVTNDQTLAKYEYHGTALPVVYGGISNTLNYRNFAFSFLMTYSIGGKTYDTNYANLMSASAGKYGSALHTDMLDRWTTPGQETNVPAMNSAKASDYGAASSRWLVNSSYLALKSASLSYSLPASVYSRLNLSGLRVYASGENLFIATKRKGMDPQANFNGTTQNVYLPSRIITFGLNLSF